MFAALPDICSGHKVIDVGGMHVQFEELQSFPAEAGGGFIHVDDPSMVHFRDMANSNPKLTLAVAS